MEEMSATYRDGQVVFDSPVDWPNGTRVSVVLAEDRIGISESEWPTTPEGIAALLARMDATEPLVMDEEELAMIEQARREAKQFAKDSWEKHARKLENLF